MKKKIVGAASVALLSLTLAVPAYANHNGAHNEGYGGANGGNGGLGNGMGTTSTGMADGTRVHSQSFDLRDRSNVNGNRDVSIYGTGTGNQFLNGTGNNANTPGTAGRYTGYSTDDNRRVTRTDGTYRAAATTGTGKSSNWGWLGLFGLLGLIGLRSRSPQGER
ncbi:WGxxGxxG family protein [Cohnella fermenti]|uniref:WGxxGxxG-CTERM domain-containing protein n=1 Tax=Cohnella fermenti TaxID=2565925 RepID=A0A4S4BJ12_9BACL|nr:WGxxGxxG family protein [Cohnella fermenti]THF74627.1 hypothetical protein E6C55_24845 [Cohnella fermenti]